MKNGYDDRKVTSISEARRKKAAAGKGRSSRSVRDWLIGGLFVAMALGMVAHAGLAVYQWLSAVTR